MGLIGNFWHRIQTFGLPPIELTDNPRVHAFVLGAIALTFALALLQLIKTRQPAALRSLGFNVPVIVLVWLGYSTPPDRLFGFTPNGATTIAAWTVHGLLALMPLVLVVIWLAQLGLSPLRLPGIAIELGACALLVIGLETLGWPGDLVAVLEALISAVVFLALALVAAKLIRNSRVRHALAMLAFGVWSAALLLLLFAHTIQSPLVALCLLFLAIVCLDGLAGTRGWRFVVTVPLVLAVGLLGAANVFLAYAHSPGLSSGIWLEAASAGAVFLFVAAIFDWTRQRIDKRQTDAEKHLREKQRADRDLALARQRRDFAQWLVDQITGREALLTSQQQQRNAQNQAEERHLEHVTHLARNLERELDGILALLFFAILVAYYVVVYFVAYLPDPVPLLRPIAGATLITVAGIALNWLITRSVRDAQALRAEAHDDTFGDPIFDPVRHIVRVFLFLVLALYALGGQLGSIITQGDCSDPGNTSCVLIDHLHGLTHTAGAAPLALLGNGSFWIAAGSTALGAALVLLAFGQWRFVSLVNRAKKAEREKSESEGASVARVGADKGARATAAGTQSAAAQPAAATRPSLAPSHTPAAATAPAR